MPVYTFENRCIEDLSLSLSDDSVKVFLNASADLSRVDMSVEKKNLLHYVAFGEPEDDFTRNIDKAVQIVKSNEEWRKEYMKFESLQAQARAEGKAEGLAEGRAEGLAQGKAETVKSFYNSGRINEQDAATELGISVDEFLSMIKQ